MSAPQIHIYIPDPVNTDAALARIVEELSLAVDQLPPGFPCEFSAQFRRDGAYLLIEYRSEVTDFVGELTGWEMPTKEYKLLLSRCRSGITIHYRGIEYARSCLKTISEVAGDFSSRCIIDNGQGCLLKLSDVATSIARDPAWTWEREEFPELDGVASSEWKI